MTGSTGRPRPRSPTLRSRCPGCAWPHCGIAPRSRRPLPRTPAPRGTRRLQSTLRGSALRSSRATSTVPGRLGVRRPVPGRSASTTRAVPAPRCSSTWTCIRASLWRSFGTSTSRSRWRPTARPRRRPPAMRSSGSVKRLSRRAIGVRHSRAWEYRRSLLPCMGVRTSSFEALRGSTRLQVTPWWSRPSCRRERGCIPAMRFEQGPSHCSPLRPARRRSRPQSLSRASLDGVRSLAEYPFRLSAAVLRCCTTPRRGLLDHPRWPLICVGTAGFEPTTP